jgi:hypothetical protein
VWRPRCWLIQRRLPQARMIWSLQPPTVKEIVEILSAALQRPIRYVDITDEQWAEA